MTRTTNNDGPSNNRSRSSSGRRISSGGQGNRNSSQNKRPPRKPNNAKNYSKGMILLKSTVFALFIVLVTLVAAFMIIKNKGGNINHSAKCKENAEIAIKSKIDEIVVEDSKVYVLTEANSGKQEVVKLGKKCLQEKGRVTFQIKSK